jgi:EAL domain-containing protein (putative c-di-GMP-specific phosphodiesterase class I)
VETAEQAARRQGLGCELGQGYFFAPPMEREDALAGLQARRADH